MSTFLFIVFPYVAVILAVGVGLYRYWTNRYSYSSVSSQLLENTKLFWGSVPWHYGITLILLAHVFAWLFPGLTGSILGFGPRLFAFEVAGLALALFAAVAIVILIARRLPTLSRARAVTSPMDWILLFVLLVQVLTGAAVALFDRWGSHWFLSTAAPWLWSLVSLRPDAATVAPLPPLIQFHFLLGFAVILLFPFTRLVHVVMLPIYYLWRPYQVVVWYRDPRRRLASVPASRATPMKSPISSAELKE
jgi:nitrate reductase gamma subunit